jgi:hypothetical protein
MKKEKRICGFCGKPIKRKTSSGYMLESALFIHENKKCNSLKAFNEKSWKGMKFRIKNTILAWRRRFLFAWYMFWR